MKRKWLHSDWFATIAIVLLVLAGRSTLADHYHVPTGSMEYSLLPGDRVLVDKTAYGVRIPWTKIDLFGARSPERGDVAVFDSPRDGARLIKRIVAVGGDRVSLQDGLLTINGRPLAPAETGGAVPEGAVAELFGERAALLNLADGGGPDIDELVVPPGYVLALGDHRGDSLDGRYFGLIDERELLGRAFRIYYRRGEGFVWLPL